MGTVIGDAPHVTHMLPNLTGEFYHSSWESPEAFVRHVKAMDPSRAWHKECWGKDNGNFSGCKSMEEAIELAEKGWPEGIKKVERMQGAILAANPELPKAIRYELAGSIANIPRAISGNPLNMRAMDLSKSRRRPVITLISNMCDPGHVSKDSITNRAAVVCALIDQIESAGYSTEIISLAITNAGPFKACVSVVVKQSGQPLDIGRLAFSMGHSAFFRRMIFGDWGISEECRRLGPFLGSVGKIPVVPEMHEKGVYIIPSMQGNTEAFRNEETSAKDGLAFLVKKLREQKCPPFVKAEVEFEEVVQDEDEDCDF